MKTETITSAQSARASEIVALMTLDERALFSNQEIALLDKVALVVSKLEQPVVSAGLTEDGARWLENHNKSAALIKSRTGRS